MTEEDRSYYHGRISSTEAAKRLETKGKDGSFLLRMSASQEGVYTVSVMQGTTVRHVRVINKDGGYSLMQEQEGADSVWALIDDQMHRTLSSAFDAQDTISLRFPLPAPGSVIAPDLLSKAEEAGMHAEDLDEDVAAFLEGGVDTKELVRRRSMKVTKPSLKSMEDMLEKDNDLSKFLNGELSANELGRRRSMSRPSAGGKKINQEELLRELDELAEMDSE